MKEEEEKNMKKESPEAKSLDRIKQMHLGTVQVLLSILQF